MKSADYWQQRAEENALKVFRYSQRQAQLVTRWFCRAEREMSKKVVEFYRSYAEKEGVTLPAAKATMTDRRALNLTLEQCQALAKKSPLDSELKKLLDRAYLGRAISREEFLKMQLHLLSSELYNRYAETTKTSLTNVFEESYYKSLFDYQQFVGFGSSFNRISTHQIEAAVTTAWQGKNYSQRIWGDHRQTLARYLNRIVTNGFIQGSGGERMTSELRKATSMSAYDARRLIRTECNQVASRANLLAYRENGTPDFEFLAVLDYKTSERCRSMDGRHFALNEGRIGVNMPPLHPFCRSTTVPYLPDAEFDGDDTRTARSGSGETYKVPADMNYRDWHKQHVENNPAELLAEQKYKGGTADSAQYSKYLNVLGKDAPKTFDEFQNIKYTGGDDWRELKADYRSEKYYSNHLTHDEKAAVTSYISGGSYSLNASLRDGVPLTEQNKMLMQSLDSALEKLPPYEGRVVRTMDMSDTERLAFAKQNTRGKIVQCLAYTSASVLEGYHERPAVKLNIISHTGKDLRRYNTAEGEVIFRRGAKFRMVDAHMDDITFVIDAEEVT